MGPLNFLPHSTRADEEASYGLLCNIFHGNFIPTAERQEISSVTTLSRNFLHTRTTRRNHFRLIHDYCTFPAIKRPFNFLSFETFWFLNILKMSCLRVEFMILSVCHFMILEIYYTIETRWHSIWPQKGHAKVFLSLSVIN